MKITITVDVDGNSVSREYSKSKVDDHMHFCWDAKIQDMLDTLEKSKDVKEF